MERECRDRHDHASGCAHQGFADAAGRVIGIADAVIEMPKNI